MPTAIPTNLSFILFAGHLADYKYYNMDQAVTRALGIFEKEIARQPALV